MFYYIYEIKNLLNSKIYVGAHRTQNLDDGYMGSGKILLAAIKKYGKENFQKTILEYFEDEKEMFLREKEIITEDFLARKDTYNIRRGGTGGFDFINKNGLHFKGYSSAAERNKEVSGFVHREKLSSDAMDRMKEGALKGITNGKKKIREKYGVATVFSLPEIQTIARRNAKRTIKEKYGVDHPSQIPGVGDKIRKAKQETRPQLGEKNSQYGTKWITDGQTNKKIRKSEPPPQGWWYGRT